MIELATDISFGLLAIAMVLTIVRFVVGPTLADRILALDVGNMVGIGAIAIFAARAHQSLYVDVAIALSLVGFVATISFARYLLTQARP